MKSTVTKDTDQTVANGYSLYVLLRKKNTPFPF